MKPRLDGMDIWFVAKELTELIDAKVSKIFQSDDIFVFQFFIRNKGKKLLRIAPGYIYLIENCTAPAFVRPFCKLLRKYLAGTFLKELHQIRTERIIEFLFEAKDAKFFLFVELFDKGNLVLCDRDKRIIHPLHSQIRKGRTIKRGQIYQPPTLKRAIFEAGIGDFKDLDKNLSYILAVEFGLGREYAEELCLRAGLDPDKKEFSIIEINNLIAAIERFKLQKLNPVIVDDTAFPFKFQKCREKKSVYTKSFSMALEKTVIPARKISLLEKKKEKIRKIIKMQEEQIKILEKQIKEDAEKGEAVYHNYAMIRELLEEINADKKIFSWAEIKENLKNNKYIREIRDKKQEVVVRL